MDETKNESHSKPCILVAVKANSHETFRDVRGIEVTDLRPLEESLGSAVNGDPVALLAGRADWDDLDVHFAHRWGFSR